MTAVTFAAHSTILSPTDLAVNGSNATTDPTCMEPDKYMGEKSPYLSLGDVYVPIGMNLAGIFGNLVALIMLYRIQYRKHDLDARRQVKTVFYQFVRALAWADLAGQLIAGPFAIAAYSMERWPGGKELCMFHGFSMVTFGLITQILVMMMALERLAAARFPYSYPRHVTPQRAQIVLLLSWVFTLFYASLPLMGVGSYVLQIPHSWCFLQFRFGSEQTGTNCQVSRIYSLVFAGLNLLLMLVTLISNVLVIVRLLKLRRKRMRNTPETVRKHMATIQCAPKRPREPEMKMVLQLCGMALIFSACWTPLNVQIITSIITESQKPTKYDVMAIRAAAFNQILDPWIYILLGLPVIEKICKFFHKLLSFSSTRQQNVAVSQSEMALNNGEPPDEMVSPAPGKYIYVAPTAKDEVQEPSGDKPRDPLVEPKQTVVRTCESCVDEGSKFYSAVDV